VVSARSRWRTALPLALLAFSVAALLVAIAGPHVNRMLATERATVVLVLDVSRSMESRDVRPSRLAAAKQAAQRFLETVPGKLRVGLVTFSGDVFVAAVPTKDRERVRTSIASAGIGNSFGGTAIGDALARAVEVGQAALEERQLSAVGAGSASAATAGLVSIVFLSDGRQNRGLVPPLEGAALAKAAGIPVYTVALGTTNPNAPGLPWGGTRAPDPATLRAISKATDGEFFEAKSAESVSAAYEDLGSRLGRTPQKSEATVAFVAAAAAALLAGGLLASVWSPRLP
jgi:Ca-activated chloride channel family protein